MKRMLVYYLRKRVPVLLILTVAFSITTIIMMSQLSFIRYVDEGTTYTEVPGDNPFLYLCVLFSIVASITPILEFTFKMKRRSIDLFYSLPIKRIKLYSLKYILGLIEIFVLCMPQWLIAYIYVAGNDNIFNLSYFLWFGLISCVCTTAVYTFITFFFTISNSMIDGILNAIMAICILPCAINIIYLIVGKVGSVQQVELFFMRYYFLYSPQFDWAMKLYYSMCGSYYQDSVYTVHIGATIAIFLLSIASGVLFFLLNSLRNKGENVSDTSDSFFGFRVLIPAYMVTGFAVGGTTFTQAGIWVVIALAGYLGYAVFRRNFRIERRDMFSLFISVLTGVLIAIFL